MEKNQKRKGFMFMRTLYRAARSAGKAKVKQSKSPAASTSLSSSGGDQSSAVSSEMRSASYQSRSAPVQKQASSALGGFRDGNHEMRGDYGGYGGGIGDENVDVKAATYILSVRERLKMERSMDQKVY